MARIVFARPDAAAPTGAVVLGLGRGRRPEAAFATLDGDGRMVAALRRDGFSGDAGETALFLAPPPPFETVIAVGTGGRRKPPGPARLRRIGAAIADALIEADAVAVTVALELSPLQAADLAFGLTLNAYRPLSRYRTREPRDDDDRLPRLERVTVLTDDPDRAEAVFAARAAVAEGVFLARDLTDEPGNMLGPDEIVTRVRSLEALGVEVTVLDETAIAAAGLGLLAAVGRGSRRPPRLVLLRWRGCDERPLVLVGKGVTFDSGGITLKAGDDEMEIMKADMAGAAAVIGALRAVAGRRARAHVVGVLALAENMPSGRAQRPGDVWTSAAGLTVEVIDTDAEGRLILADALAFAARTLRPRAMVDIATLTGAVEDVLGDPHVGLYANDDRLANRLLKLGRHESVPLWRLPITSACDEDLKSDIADLRNCAWGSVPDNDDAARFLWHFVPRRLPWAHIDMAGKEFADEDDPFCPDSATGYGVRLFDALAGG